MWVISTLRQDTVTDCVIIVRNNMNTSMLNEKYSQEIMYINAAKEADSKDIKHYLSKKAILVRMDLIGDCVLFSDAAKAIREKYGVGNVDVVCLKNCKPIFERIGGFGNIFTLDCHPACLDYEKLDVLLQQLKKNEYDILLQPQTSKLPVADIISASVKCNQKITMESKPGNSSEEWIEYTADIYSEVISRPKGWVHELDYAGAFVRGVIDKDYKTSCPRLGYHKPRFVKGNYYVVFPGGSVIQKFWPAEKYALIMEHIWQKTGMIGVVLGVKSERDTIDRLMYSIPRKMKSKVLDLSGKTSIEDVIDIIGNARLILSNDTSGAHIACATQTPSVVIVGGWHFDRFFPYHLELKRDDDVMPLIANKIMNCYKCDWVWNNVGMVNPECLQNLKTGELSTCISKIRYEQVKNLVDRIISSKGLGKETCNEAC